MLGSSLFLRGEPQKPSTSSILVRNAELIAKLHDEQTKTALVFGIDIEANLPNIDPFIHPDPNVIGARTRFTQRVSLAGTTPQEKK